MAASDLRAWLFARPGFQHRLDDLLRSAIAQEFPCIQLAAPLAEHDWCYLLLRASLLARSDDGAQQRVALRIADTCIQSVSTSKQERIAAAVILDTMANRRTMELASSRHGVPRDMESVLPLPLRGDYVRRENENSISVAGERRYFVNRFQGDFWAALQSVSWVSASAPTSAGKSFLLRRWVCEFFEKNPSASIAFVVPTRALIQEVSDSFGEDVANGRLKNVTLHTLPMESQSQEGGHLFIYTQERLHILLGRDSVASFDALIVDEAQKVADGTRGILLEQVIHECVRRLPNVRIAFCSPHVENPSELLADCPLNSESKPVSREVTTVSQNLLFVSQKPNKPKVFSVTYRDGDKAINIGEINLEFRPNPDSKRLTAVAFAMRCESGNLVYANGQAEAEKYAAHLADLCRETQQPSVSTHPRIVELIKLVQKTVHRDYSLAEALPHGVGFHYGNMPLIIRHEVESLFRDNILRFLVCTSTLMEGVNLPCKAIFLRGPSRGRGRPIEDSDFWNLAGRAGRWGTEFQGSIVCVDPLRVKVWESPPPTIKAKYRIRKATDSTVAGVGGLLEYAEADFPREVGQKNPDFDYAASFFLSVLARGQQLESVNTIARLDEDYRQRLRAALIQELTLFELPLELIFRNPGMLPRAMKELHQIFSQMTPEQLSEHVPVLPESEDASVRYQAIFGFINTHLRANWGGDARLWQLSFLTTDWMRGRPLAYLISIREKISARHTPVPTTAAIIRQVMSDVEEYARFKIPRFLRCYLDVLIATAKERGLEEMVQHLPDLELWLELGVSMRSALSMMELGLSRTAAIELMETMAETEFDKRQVLDWLRARNLESLDIPNLVKEEVRRALARNSS